MVIAKPSCTKTRGSTRGRVTTGLSFSASRFTTSTSVANLARGPPPPLSQLALAVTGARASGGVTRATTSHGIRRTTRRLESLRTTVVSTGKSNVEAVDLAVADRTLRYRCLHLRVPSSTRDPHGYMTLHRRRRSAVSVTNWPPHHDQRAMLDLSMGVGSTGPSASYAVSRRRISALSYRGNCTRMGRSRKREGRPLVECRYIHGAGRCLRSVRCRPVRHPQVERVARSGLRQHGEELQSVVNGKIDVGPAQLRRDDRRMCG